MHLLTTRLAVFSLAMIFASFAEAVRKPGGGVELVARQVHVGPRCTQRCRDSALAGCARDAAGMLKRLEQSMGILHSCEARVYEEQCAENCGFACPGYMEAMCGVTGRQGPCPVDGCSS